MVSDYNDTLHSTAEMKPKDVIQDVNLMIM